MNLPLFWRRGSFTVPEIADIIGVTDPTLRSYMVRTPLNDFMGMKERGRIYMSGQDAFYYWLVGELIDHGVPGRTAMLSAKQFADQTADGPPLLDYVVVTHKGGVTSFESTDEPAPDRTAVVIPLLRAFEWLLEKATTVYATDEGSPNKNGTVNGQPIDEWRAGIDAELVRMPVNK